MAKKIENKIGKCGKLSSIPAPSTFKCPLNNTQRAFLVLENLPVVKTVVNKKNYRRRFMIKSKPYKNPSIVRSKNGDWCVEYKFELPDQPGKFKAFKVRDGVNYIHDPEEKERQIKSLLRDVQRQLEIGYSPFLEKSTLPIQQNDYIKELDDADARALLGEQNKKWSLEKSIKKFMAYCAWKELSPNTIRGYASFLSNFTEWLTTRNELHLPAHTYLETQLIAFLDTYHDQEDWSPRTYNNHLGFFITFFGRVAKLEKKEDRNIRYEIDLTEPEYKNDTAEKNRAYSPMVAELVKKELAASKYKYLKKFIQWIYLSCMRPREIRLLKVQHIDLSSRQIKAIGPTAKTGDRFVPISDELFDLIQEFKIDQSLPNDYLFGKHQGRTGAEAFNKDLFSLMYLEIKTKLGLDKNYTMYGWKHTRVIQLKNSGFSDESIKQLTGHKDDKSFQAYLRDLVPNSDSQMKGKTISF